MDNLFPNCPLIKEYNGEEVKSAKTSKPAGSDSIPNLNKVWTVSCILASHVFLSKSNLASSTQDSKICISTKESDLFNFIEADRPSLDGIKPNGPRTSQRSLSTPNCFDTVGIDENLCLRSCSESANPLLYRSKITDEIPHLDFRATNKFLAPTAETSPSIVTSLLANSKELLETRDLDKLISTPRI